MIAKRSEAPVHWTIADLLRWTEDLFCKLELSCPRLDAELLLAHALDVTRLELYTDHAKVVEPAERARFRALVGRRAKHEPVAYITGRREFFSLLFEVTPAVLIPRPETEHLVEVALAEISPGSRRSEKPDRTEAEASGVPGGAARVLDLGTGSGNLAVAVAVNAPGATVDAVEVSAAALDVARRNALRHGVQERIAFHQGDLFLALPQGGVRYRVIVSNPPYIAASEYGGLMADVRLYEPREALVDRKSPAGDGLGYYRTFAASAARFLEPGGILAVEVGLGQSAPAERIFAEQGWKIERVVKDYGGIERVVVLRA